MNHIESLLSPRAQPGKTPDHGLRGVADPDMILFGGGLPDPATHPREELRSLLGEALDADGRGVLGYGYEAGSSVLREFIAARANQRGASLDQRNIVITNGCAGAIDLVATALIEPGDVVFVESATYPGALKAFRQAGAHIVPVAMDAGGLDPRSLDGLLQDINSKKQRVKLLYTIATCHNPTATTLDLERRREVARLASRDHFLVVQDNTYGDIRYADAPPDFITLAPEQTIHLGSFSKTLAPGLRVGWIAAPHGIADAVVHVRNDLGTSLLMQDVVAGFFRRGIFATRLDQLNQHYRRKRDLVVSGLERHCAGFVKWHIPDGGFFTWLSLIRGNTRTLLDAAASEKVSFIPGAYFSTEPGGLAGQLRLSYGEIPEHQIDEGLRRLGVALSRISGN